jgi:iron complex transport system substrate-binding protein
MLLAGLALPLIVACGRAADGAKPSETAWTFTDDRGETVSLPKRPERIVASTGIAAALWDYGVRVVGTFGPRRLPDGSRDPRLGAMDLDQIESVAEVFGELDVEKLAALRPDLVVSQMYESPQLWWAPKDIAARVSQVAPTVGIQARGLPIDQPIGRLEELAGAVGADLDAPTVAEARQRYEQASARVRAAAAARPDLTVLVTTASLQTLYISRPDNSADLLYFQQLGLKLVKPTSEGTYFEELSWEEALKYPADLILRDARPGVITPVQLTALPTWNEMPAVKAGQVGPWRAEAAFSHLRFATILDELAGIVERSRADVV